MHVKVSALGPPGRLRQGLLLVPAGYTPSPAPFSPFRRPGIIYASGEANAFRTLYLQPEGFRTIAQLLHDRHDLSAILQRDARRPVGFSLAIVDAVSARGPNFAEMLLTPEETRALLLEIGGRLKKQHAAEAQALASYARKLGR